MKNKETDLGIIIKYHRICNLSFLLNASESERRKNKIKGTLTRESMSPWFPIRSATNRSASYSLSISDTYEPCHEKTNGLVSDLVRHKPGCTATEDG